MSHMIQPSPQSNKISAEVHEIMTQRKGVPMKRRGKRNHEKKNTLTFVDTRCHKFVSEF